MDHTKRIEKIEKQLALLTEEISFLRDDLADSSKGQPEGMQDVGHDDVGALLSYLALGSDLEEDALLNMLLRCAMYSVGAGGAGLTLFDSKKNVLVFRAALGDGAEGIIGYELPLEDSRHGLAFLTGKVQSSTPTHDGAAVVTATEFRNVLVAPLFVGVDGVGTISAVNKKDADQFTAQDMEAYRLFADLAALVVQQKLREQLVSSMVAGHGGSVPAELSAVKIGSDMLELVDIVQNMVEVRKKRPEMTPLLKQLTFMLVRSTDRGL